MGEDFNGKHGRMPAEVKRWGPGGGLTLAEVRRLGREEAAKTVDYSLPPIRGDRVTKVAQPSFIADWDGI